MADTDLEVEVIIESALWEGREEGIVRAVKAAAHAEKVAGQVDVLLTDDAAMARLNQAWRGKATPTNVLSFPAANTFGRLGDIAMGAEIVTVEAHAQGKTVENHAAHLAVHGFLHLIGYDHESEPDAERMEARERAILAAFGVSDPYADRAGPLKETASPL